MFTDQGLAKYDVVLFLNTTGNTLDDGMKTVRRQALQDFIEKKGRGFVGIHSATDTYQKKDPYSLAMVRGFHRYQLGGPGANGDAGSRSVLPKHDPPHSDGRAGTPNPWSRTRTSGSYSAASRCIRKSPA